MWVFITLFCSIYYFSGLIPIGYYAWYSNWGLFWLYVAYWIVNLVMLEYAKDKLSLE